MSFFSSFLFFLFFSFSTFFYSSTQTPSFFSFHLAPWSPVLLRLFPTFFQSPFSRFHLLRTLFQTQGIFSPISRPISFFLDLFFRLPSWISSVFSVFSPFSFLFFVFFSHSIPDRFPLLCFVFFSTSILDIFFSSFFASVVSHVEISLVSLSSISSFFSFFYLDT